MYAWCSHSRAWCSHSPVLGGIGSGQQYSFVYIAHPRAVTGFVWRNTSPFMPRFVCGVYMYLYVYRCVCVCVCVCVREILSTCVCVCVCVGEHCISRVSVTRDGVPEADANTFSSVCILHYSNCLLQDLTFLK